MGIGYNELCFLKHVHKTNEKFGKVALIGRQSIAIDKKNQEKILGTSYSGYCEKLLIEQFGASKVDSYDVNDYENATHIYDFNLPFDSKEKYDCVIDFGTLEHIFDIKTALTNIFNLTKIDGLIMHANPVNMYPGHGLYQFGLDFYCSFYQKQSCFDLTKIFLARYDKNLTYWYKLSANKLSSDRIIFSDTYEVGSLIFTKKISENINFKFNQSDYEHKFENSKKDLEEIRIEKTIMKNLKTYLKKFQVLLILNSIIGKITNAYFASKLKYNRKLSKNKNFQKIYF